MTAEERNQLEVLRAEMNGKLDLLVERTGNMSTIQSDHETRLRSIERWKYALPISVLLALTSVLAAWKGK